MDDRYYKRFRNVALLGNIAKVNPRFHTYREGVIESVTKRGITVKVTEGIIFVKWCNVTDIREPIKHTAPAITVGTEQHYQGEHYLTNRGIQVRLSDGVGAIEDEAWTLQIGDKEVSSQFTIKTLPFDFGVGKLNWYGVSSDGAVHDFSPEAKE